MRFIVLALLLVLVLGCFFIVPHYTIGGIRARCETSLHRCPNLQSRAGDQEPEAIVYRQLAEDKKMSVNTEKKVIPK
jgi:hypothetical protein